LTSILEYLAKAREGRTTSDCIDYLIELNEFLKSKKLIEIGVGPYGTSNLALLYFCERHSAHLYSIDITKYSNVVERNKKLGLDKFWTYIVRDSREVGKEWNIQVDFLFINSGHTYDLTLSELQLFSPFVKPSGIITMHDTKIEDCPRIHREVRKAMFEFLKNNLNYKVLELKAKRGFSVLYQDSKISDFIVKRWCLE